MTRNGPLRRVQSLLVTVSLNDVKPGLRFLYWKQIQKCERDIERRVQAFDERLTASLRPSTSGAVSIGELRRDLSWNRKSLRFGLGFLVVSALLLSHTTPIGV